MHGGDIYRNVVHMDFSVNVNPLGMPEGMEEAMCAAVKSCGNYPDPSAEKLYYTISHMLLLPKEYLLFGNGASELFMAIVHGLKPGKTVILVPSFYGYEYVAKAGGGEVVYYPLLEANQFQPDEGLLEALTEDVNLLFLANPNNPTGKLIEPMYLERLLDICKQKGITVVLDECFIEFCDGTQSMLPKIDQYENLIVVRAFTKIYAIPGVRLGYLVCKNQVFMDKIKCQLPEWNLSAFAQAAGEVCEGQEAFIHQTVEYVKKERIYLSQKLRKLGLLVYSGEANFILVYSEKMLYEGLLEHGILIRDCENFRGLSKGFYRIAVKSRKENEALLKALEKIV